MRNRFPGTCYRCGLRVEAGDGHFEKRGHAWRVQHADCAIRWRGKQDVPTNEARAAHVTAAGQQEEVR